MTLGQSTKPRKPKKPRRDYPLFAHASGQWAKKCNGKLHYFGKWDDPDAAEALWDQQKDHLRQGLVPRQAPDSNGGTTLREVCNQFLSSKKLKVEIGELSPRTFADLEKACEHLIGRKKDGSSRNVINAFGKGRLLDDIYPEDFRGLKAKLAKRFKSPNSLRREMINIRSVFNFAMRNDFTDKRIKFGDDFTPPGKKATKIYRNQQRAKHGERCFAADQLSKLIDSANPAMKAMIMLAINCGLGNADVKGLSTSHLQLKKRTLDFPRSKTAVERRAKLWPETVQAIEDYIKVRKKPKDKELAHLLFTTKCGQSWEGSKNACPVSAEFKKLLDETSIYRPGLSFYAIRHTYRTIADATMDQVAIDLTMGHSRNDMASEYREHIPDEDERLQRVADHVRTWMFGDDR